MTRICHYNNEDKPLRVQRWVLLQSEFDNSDMLWINGCGMEVFIDRPTHTFETSSGKTHTIAGTPRIEITTKTDKQRDMLVLKYGNNAILLSDFIVAPHSTMMEER